MKIKLFFTSVILLIGFRTLSQNITPFTFGFELDFKLKKIDPNTRFDSPTGAAYVGMFAEFHVTNHFSSKLRVGMNNIYFAIDESIVRYENGESEIFPGLTTVKQTLGISLEPRFYFFSTEQLRKINFYAALPVGYESTPFRVGVGFSYVRPEFMIVPTLGCNYKLAKHWEIEASGGLGFGQYYMKQNNPIVKQQMEYGLSAGIRYIFKK